MNKALSDRDIKNLLGNQTKVVVYSDLHKVSDIYQLLKPYGNCVILYMTKENYGHWTCIIDHPERNSIEFFDSYGIKPDREFDEISEESRLRTDQLYPCLSNLLLESKKEIEYNKVQLQELKKNISTCGRHCVIRIICKDIPIDDYVKLMSVKNPDKTVLKLTQAI